jgi:hypothetical protein
VPRRPRVFIEGGIYHLYYRFARGAAIFSEGDEAERFLELLKYVKVRDGLTVFAWALMASHYHLCLRAGPVTLARTMGYVQARCGQDHNSRWKSSGPRWRMRPRAYLGEICRLLDIDPMEPGSEGKGRELSRTRYLMAALGVERWGQDAKRLGEVVGRRGDVVSRWVRRGSQIRETDEAFRDAHDELDRALAASGASAAKSTTTKIVRIVGPGTSTMLK